MRPELDLERKIWLLRHPGVVRSISRNARVSESLVYQVLRGEKRSARIAAALEAAGAHAAAPAADMPIRAHPAPRSAGLCLFGRRSTGRCQLRQGLQCALRRLREFRIGLKNRIQ